MTGEIRIPAKLLSSALSLKMIKALRLLATAKLNGHRSEIATLLHALKIHPKTGGRLISKIIESGWAGTDDTFIFPRSWRRLSMNKRGGLYITTEPKHLKKFEGLCFAIALKKALSRKAGPRPERGRTTPTDLPTTYLAKALRVSVRRFERLKAQAQRYGFITSKEQLTPVGSAKEFGSIRKHLSDRPVFVRGKFTVVPGPSKITVKV